MVTVLTQERGIDLFYRAKNGEGAAPEDWSLEACYLYEWLGEEESRCDALDNFLTEEFPNGTDEDEYFEFFRDEWKRIAEAVGCPEHYLKEGY